MNMKLYQIADQYLEALQVLDDPDLPAQAVADTLEALQGEVAQKGQAVAAFTLNLAAEIDALKAHEKKIAARRKALESKEEWLRSYLKSNMQRCGITEIKAIDGTFKAKLGKGRPSVVVTDESLIPDDSKFVRWTRSVDKTAIAAAIAAGEQVPGAHVEINPQLRLT